MASTMETVAMQDNVTIETDGKKMVITIDDISKDFGKSKSGGIQHIVAQTGGFIRDLKNTNGMMLMLFAGRK